MSLDSVSVCIVDTQGKILKEAKVASEPEVLIAWFFAAHGTPMARIGLEASSLMTRAGRLHDRVSGGRYNKCPRRSCGQ